MNCYTKLRCYRGCIIKGYTKTIKTLQNLVLTKTGRKIQKTPIATSMHCNFVPFGYKLGFAPSQCSPTKPTRQPHATEKRETRAVLTLPSTILGGTGGALVEPSVGNLSWPYKRDTPLYRIDFS